MRPGEPFISCSMTLMTLSSSVCAEAPGYTALTTIEGGATGGYCEIGSCVTDTAPSTMMNIAITQAKIGRSMKNLAIRKAFFSAQRTPVPQLRHPGERRDPFGPLMDPGVRRDDE